MRVNDKMIQINQIKMPLKSTAEDLRQRTAKLLRISPGELIRIKILKQSLDARKKEEIHYSYTVQAEVANEAKVLSRSKGPNIQAVRETIYTFPKGGMNQLHKRPVIIGSGPAGLFCALMLARNCYRPLLLERGEDVAARTRKVEAFWAGGALDPDSNVQFGEGGAGTFSDGKLNTLVKDPAGRNRLVLEIFAEFGADPAICYQNKPHIGTDVLSGIVSRMRGEIISRGGEVRFLSQVTDLVVTDGRLAGVMVNGQEMIEAQAVVLAVGHSARDTFAMLERRRVPMEQKAFAVGLRIQHPQAIINESQYHSPDLDSLGAASYKLTRQTSLGRGVYSFCMCPGGYVVNASSEAGRLAVNGMSYHDRSGGNANSALIVTVTPEDFPGDSPLSGIAYQRALEEAAFGLADGRIPVQLYGDFKAGRISSGFGAVKPQMKGAYGFADLKAAFPAYLGAALAEGVEYFGTVIAGFDREDAIFAGIESRTSSPLRILRDKGFESELKGLYPCGEGAGYAGGITSAAMDGIRVAEELAARYKPN